jgi:hypothetical protein
MAYRTAVHPTTGETPYFLLHGTDAVIPEDLLFTSETEETTKLDVSTFATKKFQLMKQIFRKTRETLAEFASKEQIREGEKRQPPLKLESGRRVMVYHPETRTTGDSTKLESRFSGPYRITHISADKRVLNLWHPLTGKDWVVNSDRVKAFDPWEEYTRNSPEFWDSWIREANNPEPLNNQLPYESQYQQEESQRLIQSLEMEEEEIRKSQKRKYETVIQVATSQKPRQRPGQAFARNWKGQWMPYSEATTNFEVIRLLDRRYNQKLRQYEWLTQWKGDWLPTWEPKPCFEKGKTTGLALVWREFERKKPYGANEVQQPSMRGINQRKR